MQYYIIDIIDFGNWEWGIAVNKNPKCGSALGIVQWGEAWKSWKNFEESQ